MLIYIMQTYLGLVLIKQLKKVQSKQKHTLRIIFDLSKTSPSEPLFLSLDVLNVSQINIFHSVQFMHKINSKNVPHIFLKLFGAPYRAYTTSFSLINFSVPRTFLKTSRFAVSVRGPLLWNNCRCRCLILTMSVL